jgi:hypothetical protein
VQKVFFGTSFTQSSGLILLCRNVSKTSQNRKQDKKRKIIEKCVYRSKTSQNMYCEASLFTAIMRFVYCVLKKQYLFKSGCSEREKQPNESWHCWRFYIPSNMKSLQRQILYVTEWLFAFRAEKSKHKKQLKESLAICCDLMKRSKQ